MGVINKRNAVLGWTVWQVGKRAAKRKARDAVPGSTGDSKRPNKGAIAAGLAAVGGAVWFWRRRRSDDETTETTTS
jgi:LPXTG-motif cell wall-anchored protein